jgi:hypothetical protein
LTSGFAGGAAGGSGASADALKFTIGTVVRFPAGYSTVTTSRSAAIRWVSPAIVSVAARIRATFSRASGVNVGCT